MADLRGYVTAAGQQFEALAKQMGYPVEIGVVEIGDGLLPDNESPISRTKLVNKIAEFPASVEQDPKNPGQWIVWIHIPADHAINGAGYFIREMGCKLINQGAGILYAYRRVSNDWKPVDTSGEAKSFIYKLRFIPGNGELLKPTIDPSVVLASRDFVENRLLEESNKARLKQSVKVTTTGNVDLFGLLEIDGVALLDGDRVLVKNQNSAKDNGIYVSAKEKWKRAADADSNSSVNSGLLVSVEQGSLHRGSLWQLVTPSRIILGSSGLLFERISGKTGVAAGGYNRVTVGDRGEILSGSDTVVFRKDQVFPTHVFRKNQLINGNFDVWQRGSVFTTPNKGAYTADRWRVDYDGTPGTFTVSRQPWSPGGNPRLESAYYLRWAQTAPSAGGTTRTLSQRIESVRTMAGLDVTVSFIAWADAPCTIAVKLSQYFGAAGASAAASTAAQSIDITTIPTAYAITFAVPAINGKTITGVNDYLELQFMLPVNVVYSINIATVQLEEGDIKTPFEHRPISYELLLCQRYFEVLYDPDRYYSSVGNHSKGIISGGDMQGINAFTMAARIDYKTTKRAIPALGNISLNAGSLVGQHKMISEYGLLCVSGGNGPIALISAIDLVKPAWVDAEL